MKYVYFVRGPVHAAMAYVSLCSVVKADPAAQFVVYTDRPKRELDAQWDPMRVPVVEFDSRGAPLMLANLDAQCRAIAAEVPSMGMVFLDTDTIMLQMLPVNVDDDLVVTWRAAAMGNSEGVAKFMPYNYGVIGVRAGYRSLQAFMWMRERIRSMSPALQGWYGNQVALAALAGPRPDDGKRVVSREIPWTLTSFGDAVTVRQVPCSRYNYTPQMVGERIHGTRSVLHFKGKKRHLMQVYAERLNLPWPAVLREAQDKLEVPTA